MLDAFDECSEVQQDDLLHFIRTVTPSGVRILVSTRTHQVSKLFNLDVDYTRIEVNGDNEDIKRYLTGKLNSKRLHNHLKQEIVQKVAQKADGMFVPIIWLNLTLLSGFCLPSFNYNMS